MSFPSYAAAERCVDFILQAARASGDEAVVAYFNDVRWSLVAALAKEIAGREGVPLPRVEKIGGDYAFRGTIRASLTKSSGAVRVVVENDEGLLHIFNPEQLRPVR